MLTLGDAPGDLRLNLKPGAVFTGRVEYQDPPGTPAAWPSGTTAWLRHSVPGSSFERIWPASIDGAVMSWLVQPDDVAEIPLRDHAELWLDYPGNPAFVWLEGSPQFGCSNAGFGYIAAVPLPGSGAVAVPVPGPAGPPGLPGSGAGAGFEHIQSAPAATWTISHGLGRTPYSLLVVVGGQLVIPDAVFPDGNTAVLTFAAPTSGRAEFS